MKVGFFATAICASFLFLGLGCAPQAVILNPGQVEMPENAKRFEGPAAWSLWVSGARDVRAPGKAGQKVGTLYTRFQQSPQTAFLDRNPEVYVKEQLSRYLLHRGLEASGPQTAKVDLTVDLEEFSMVEDPGALWDEITVRVAYTVNFSDTSGRDLGRVRLEGQAQVKSPLNSEKQTDKALGDALADTFDALARSEVFQKIIQEVSR